MSGARNADVPATNTFAPARPASAAVSGSIPPSTSMWNPSPRSSRRRAAASHFGNTSRMKLCPPNPGTTVITNSRSIISKYGAAASNQGNIGGEAYTTADIVFGGQIDLGKGRWTEMNIGVSNIFNANYTPPGAIFDAPGMSLFASFSFDV